MFCQLYMSGHLRGDQGQVKIAYIYGTFPWIAYEIWYTHGGSSLFEPETISNYLITPPPGQYGHHFGRRHFQWNFLTLIFILFWFTDAKMRH